METLELEKNPTFGIQDGAIEILREEYMPLEIRDVNDKEGYNAVHAARMDVKKRRVAVEHKRKELNADAQEYIRAVNGEAKRITSLLEPIETHLAYQESSYANEKARLAREAEERREAALRKRLDALTEAGCLLNPRDVEAMSDDEFANVLEIKRSEFEARQREEARKRAREDRNRTRYETLRELDCLIGIPQIDRMTDTEFEAARQKAAEDQAHRLEEKRAEEKRLATERAELEAQRKEQAQREAELRAERDRLAREEAERKRLADIEQAKRDAEERTRREAEEHRQREERARIEREKAEAEAQRLAEEAKPDQERIRSVANLVGAIVVPSLSERNQEAGQRVRHVLDRAEASIRTIASEIGIVLP